MYRTLFFIPNKIGPVPFLIWNENYGFGLVWLALVLTGGLFLFSKVRREGWSGDAVSSLFTLIAAAVAYVFLVPKIVEPQGLPVQGYGMMLLLAVVLGIGLAVHRSRQMGVNPEIIYSLVFWVFIGGVLGARLFYVAEYYRDFLRYDADNNLQIGATLLAMVNLTRGGLVVYGSLIGASIPFALFTLKYRLPILPLTDYLVASLVLGQGIGRIGCLLNGCCYGGVCEHPRLPAISFPAASPAHIRQVEEGRTYLHGLKLIPGEVTGVRIAAVEPGSAAEAAGLKPQQDIAAINGVSVRRLSDAYQILFGVSQPGDTVEIYVLGRDAPVEWALQSTPPGSLPVHPTQIYSAIGALLFAFFAWVYFPFRRRDGQVFATLLTLFPITRFLEEIIRTDEPQNFLWGMTISQTISIGLVLCSVAFWWWVLQKPKDSTMGPQDWQPYNERWAKEH